VPIDYNQDVKTAKTAKIGELRDGLSRYIKHVRSGGTVIVYERDTPVAEIIPIRQPKSRAAKDEERIARLEAKGCILRGTGSSRWAQNLKPRKIHGLGSVLEALLEERESGW
jgi:antitoxin (DNA-binding transcriptional repressor) of toxin-antitoxin stability system